MLLLINKEKIMAASLPVIQRDHSLLIQITAKVPA